MLYFQSIYVTKIISLHRLWYSWFNVFKVVMKEKVSSFVPICSSLSAIFQLFQQRAAVPLKPAVKKGVTFAPVFMLFFLFLFDFFFISLLHYKSKCRIMYIYIYIYIFLFHEYLNIYSLFRSVVVTKEMNIPFSLVGYNIAHTRERIRRKYKKVGWKTK